MIGRGVRQPRNRLQRGVATVEAAITLLGFMALLLAIMEGARLMSIQQALTDAVREGARLGVAPESGTTTLPSYGEVEAEVRRFLDAARVPTTTVTVGTFTNADGEEFTTVLAETDVDLITLSFLGAGPVSLEARSVMMNETSP